MRQEAFDSPSTQILSLYALANYLSTNPELTVSILFCYLINTLANRVPVILLRRVYHLIITGGVSRSLG